MNNYQVTATREGSWWLLTVPELDTVTQARRLDQAEATARDLIAVWLDVPADTFDVTVTPVLDDKVRRQAEDVTALQASATRATTKAAKAARDLASSLLAQGYTVRDAGAILGVTPQRVSQLTTAQKTAATKVPRHEVSTSRRNSTPG